VKKQKFIYVNLENKRYNLNELYLLFYCTRFRYCVFNELEISVIYQFISYNNCIVRNAV